MRYTKYTHKVSIPMREELYEFLETLPRGSRTDMGRNFFLTVKKILNDSPTNVDFRTNLRKLINGEYIIYVREHNETRRA